MKQGSRALVAALVLFTVLFTVGSSGCSLAFQSHIPDRAGAPAATPAQVASCSTSRVLPWVDVGAIAAELVVATTGMLAHGDVIDLGRDARGDTGTVIVGTALFGAILQTASAGNGFRRADACERARTGQAPAVTASAL